MIASFASLTAQRSTIYDKTVVGYLRWKNTETDVRYVIHDSSMIPLYAFISFRHLRVKPIRLSRPVYLIISKKRICHHPRQNLQFFTNFIIAEGLSHVLMQKLFTKHIISIIHYLMRTNTQHVIYVNQTRRLEKKAAVTQDVATQTLCHLLYKKRIIFFLIRMWMWRMKITLTWKRNKSNKVKRRVTCDDADYGSRWEQASRVDPVSYCKWVSVIIWWHGKLVRSWFALNKKGTHK